MRLMWHPETPPQIRARLRMVPPLDIPPRARVGLLGGSFNPAHAGHLHISMHAMRRFALDRIVWLVSPGNPLKANKPAMMEKRMRRARDFTRPHPHILISDFEARVHTRFTADTLDLLRARHPEVRFVWLMGADNLGQFHLWRHWQHILNTIPVGVLARPGERLSGRTSAAARIFRHAMLPAQKAPRLADAAPPAWCFVNLPMVPHSSTDIRAAGDWPGPK